MPIARVASGELHYRDSGGGGVPLVLLHGFPLSGEMWAPQLDALGGRFRIVAPDLPGFGRSQAPADPGAWRIERYAAAVEGLLAHLGIERAVIAGLSMGGYVALSLIQRAPSLFLGVVLVDTKAGADTDAVREGREAQQQEVMEEGTDGLAPRLLEKLLAPARLGDPTWRERILALMHQSRAGYLAALEAMKRRPDSTPALGGIEVPTLVVVGAEDVLTPPAVARGMASVIRGARLAELPGAGHLSNLEEGEAFNRVLASFMEQFEAPEAL